MTLSMTATANDPAGDDSATLPVQLSPYGLTLVGAGQFRVLGFHLYDASYWRSRDGAQALKIVYRKNIPGAALNKQMEQEWVRLSPASPARRAAWSAITARIWPNVSAGSALIAMAHPGSHTDFLDGDGIALGRVDDAAFGPAFLGIWLDPNTRAKKLRAELLGGRRA